ncbi:tetratricopeptide repeat protein [Saccharothrix violaceirubra]|uniref:Tetratricopeptide (TPR) repeat protein n=1 Tax=Saccharothrix violaceirubra TaxID=413306 RepID=A0A7W7T1R4_9PSEU|nr:tetratricopeptide repeat protein [Saccharothrix violaceirubra]MBB4964979.1 tetratricopeptide (TPR) repeat protein [Saccharothrix violaceirubra]
MAEADVVALRDFTHDLRALDHRYGGLRSCAEVTDRLPSALALLSRPAHDRIVVPLRTAVADLFNLVAWTSFDVGRVGDSLAHFGTALKLASSIGHDALMANIYYRLGRVWLHHNAPGPALAEFRLGERAARRAGSALALAVVNVNQAWAYAHMGMEHEALALLSDVPTTFAHAQGEPVSDWAAFFTPADLSGMTGVIHTQLGQSVDPRFVELAVPALDSAWESYPAEMVRSRAFCLVALATCHLLDDQVDTAIELGGRAVALCEGLESARVVERLRPLRNEALRRRNRTDAAALVERIGRLRAVVVGLPRPPAGPWIRTRPRR